MWKIGYNTKFNAFEKDKKKIWTLTVHSLYLVVVCPAAPHWLGRSHVTDLGNRDTRRPAVRGRIRGKGGFLTGVT